MNLSKQQKSKDLTLYYNSYSNCAQRVMLLLAEKGIEPKRHPINLLKNEQLNDGFRAINPKCQVPAIVHQGRPMSESVDILRYLEHQFPTPCLTPDNDADRRSMDLWLDEAANSHESLVVEYVYAHGFGRLPTQAQDDYYKEHVPHRARFHQLRRQGKVAGDPAGAAGRVHDLLSRMEQQLQYQPYLAGQSYSLADIAWFPTLYLLQIFKLRLHSYPAVRDWMVRLRTRPAYRDGVKAYQAPIPHFLLRFIVRWVRRTGGRF